MDYGVTTISRQARTVPFVAPRHDIVSGAKWLSLGLMMIDAGLWAYALADIPLRLLGS